MVINQRHWYDRVNYDLACWKIRYKTQKVRYDVVLASGVCFNFRRDWNKSRARFKCVSADDDAWCLAQNVLYQLNMVVEWLCLVASVQMLATLCAQTNYNGENRLTTEPSFYVCRAIVFTPETYVAEKMDLLHKSHPVRSFSKNPCRVAWVCLFCECVYFILFVFILFIVTIFTVVVWVSEAI